MYMYVLSFSFASEIKDLFASMFDWESLLRIVRMPMPNRRSLFFLLIQTVRSNYVNPNRLAFVIVDLSLNKADRPLSVSHTRPLIAWAH